MTVGQGGVVALVTLTLAGCADDHVPTDRPEARRGRFEMVWSDEFDGSAIDESKWYVRDAVAWVLGAASTRQPQLANVKSGPTAPGV
jgi:beta-glucanase (GH16 family)